MWAKLPLLALLLITLSLSIDAKRSIKKRASQKSDEKPLSHRKQPVGGNTLPGRKPILNGGNNGKSPIGKEPVDKKQPMKGQEKEPSSNGKTSDKKLVFVQAIWRHGDRAPGSLPYPNDKNGEDKWPRGWNQLTNEGMRQLKDLGQFMRKRYAGRFVNETFNGKEILIQSSDKARAIVSAQSLLNGFFPPAAHETFEEGLNWHPIPVHSNGIDNEDPVGFF